MKDTAAEDSLASIIQGAAMEMGFISYVNRINHKWWGVWILISQICDLFCFNNVGRNTGIDKKLSWLSSSVDLFKKNRRFFSLVIDVFVFFL